MVRGTIEFTPIKRGMRVKSQQTERPNQHTNSPSTKVRLKSASCKAEGRQLSWHLNCATMIVAFKQPPEKTKIQVEGRKSLKSRKGDRFKMVLSPTSEDGRFFDSRGHEILSTSVIVEQTGEGNELQFVGDEMAVSMVQIK